MKTEILLPTGAAACGKPVDMDAVYRKITGRLVPLLFLCYLTAYVDRNNIGLAKLQMQTSLVFSDAAYGLAASMFFIGVLLFEIPSNLMLRRVGARKTMLRIMVLWGVISSATLFVKTPAQFYVVRFLLGAFEAGFFPGVILYLTFWYPPERRARVVALFMTAAVAASLITGPVSGWILKALHGPYGLDGWQWLMLLEGMPSIVLGVAVFFVLPERPSEASWLTPAERDAVLRDLQRGAGPSVPMQSVGRVFRDPRVYVLGFATFTLGCAANFITFWLPSIIKDLGVTDLQHVGLYATIPSLIGTVAMVAYGRHSDRHQERRLHFIGAAGVGVAGLCAITWAHDSLGWSLAAAVVATCGIVCAYPIFWAMATRYLSRDAAPAGIALISSLGALSGTSSALVGTIKAQSGSLDHAMYLIAAQLILGILMLTFFMPHAQRDTATLNIAAREMP